MKSIFYFLPVLFLAWGPLSAQKDPDSFEVTQKYFNDELGSRLIVRPDAPGDSRVADLELRVTDHTVFDTEAAAFKFREVVTIQGGGLGSPGLLFFTDAPRSREEFIQVLEDFVKKTKVFRRNQNEIEDLDESWMGDPASALSQAREIGTLETDFLRRPAKVTLNWDVRNKRLWLSLDDFINIDSRIAEPLLELLRQIPVYSRDRERYAAEIAERNRRIDQELDLAE